MRVIIPFAALPALLGSLFIIRAAQASLALTLQQLLVSVVAAAIYIFATERKNHAPLKLQTWVFAAASLLLALPIFNVWTPGPRRWISAGSFKLYVAALVLPAVILVLAQTLRSNRIGLTWPLVATVALAALLAVQPDASQVTAFALAATIAILVSKARPTPKLCSFAGLIACVVLAWRQPDPLEPVPYVEGVLDIAWAAGLTATIVAVLAIALPPAVLSWQARATRSWELLAVAAYYATIDFLAFRQLTPMPLLGFGVSPILGYCLLSILTARVETAKAN